MQGISKRFGATQALRGVDLEVHSGEVLALIGENGAGKSTLMKILSGAHAPDAGRIELAGTRFAPRGPHDARLAGVAMIYQELSLAPELSVEDNIMLGQEQSTAGWLRRTGQQAKVVEALNRLGRPELRPQTPVRLLSPGAQQLVEIARALVTQARLIVFDEPTSSLAQHDAEHLFGVIDKLRRSGLGIVYISHFLEEVRRVCDRFIVLRDGQVAGGGAVAGTSEREIVRLMAGRSVEELFPRVPHEPADTILSLQGLSGVRLPRDVSFDLRRGEILGIGGLVGAGRTELLRCLLGLDPVRTGQVRLEQVTLAAAPQSRLRAGLALVSEDRKGEGLAQGRSIVDNLTWSRLGPYARWGLLNLRRRRENASQWVRRLEIKARSVEQEVQFLSGGNQQKVALGRALHQDADVLLLDEPTRGIDVGTKATIYRLIGELASRGKAIIFVSSYLPELLHICDRVGVMARGRLREIRQAGEWTEETLLACALQSDRK
jgi:ribose transport system ATP-binding protein